MEWIGCRDKRERLRMRSNERGDRRHHGGGWSRNRRCGDSNERRHLGSTLQRIVWVEHGRFVSGRSGGAISKIKLESDLEMLSNERMVETGEAVDILHHTSRPVENLEEVTEKLLSPTADLMNRTVILQNFFHGIAVAEPEELWAPKVFPILTDGPAATGSFANKRMEVTLTLGAAARAKANWAQASAVHGQIECAETIRAKQSKSDCGGVRVVGLHKDPAHAGSSPIGLQKARERRVIASKARWGGNGELQFRPEIHERWRPKADGNRLALMLTLEGTKGFHPNLKEGAVYIVESEQADERAQGLPVDRKGPVGNQIELRLGGTVSSGCDIMTDILNTVSEKLAFFELKGDTVLHEYIADTCEQTKKSSDDSGPQ
jgi:hypothetical protein